MRIFDNPMQLSTHVVTMGILSPMFEIKLSPEVVKTFAAELVNPESPVEKMLAPIAGLPEDKHAQWGKELTDFIEHLSNGRFVVNVTDFAVMDYMLHYAYGFLDDDGDNVEDTVFIYQLMAKQGGLINNERVQEFQDLLMCIEILRPCIEKQNTNVEYKEDGDKYLAYSGV